MANPTVPNADQKSAINASAPDAKSVNVPDASDNAGRTAQVNTSAQQPAQQPTTVQRTTTQADTQRTVGEVDKSSKSVDKEADQGTTPAVDLTKTSGKEYAKQQEENARQFEKNVGEDSFRKAARLEREAEEAAAEGDPTRDPVAKQAAMDMNTPAPGAKRDAQKIKNIGEREAEKQAKRDGTN